MSNQITFEAILSILKIAITNIQMNSDWIHTNIILPIQDILNQHIPDNGDRYICDEAIYSSNKFIIGISRSLSTTIELWRIKVTRDMIIVKQI
jgi:hypothetical protein